MRDWKLVTMSPKPKPVKADRKPLVKSLQVKASPAKPKRKVKTARQKLIKALDVIVREIVFARDEKAIPLIYRDLIDDESGEVQVMKTNVDHPGHIITRARMSVRWDLRNVHRQNAAHNFLHEYYPEVYNQWYIETFGLSNWNELVEDSKKVSTYSTAELETLLFNLTELQKKENHLFGYYPQKELVQERFTQQFVP